MKSIENEVFMNFEKKNITQTIPLLISYQLSSYYIIQKGQVMFVCLTAFQGFTTQKPYKLSQI